MIKNLYGVNLAIFALKFGWKKRQLVESVRVGHGHGHSHGIFILAKGGVLSSLSVYEYAHVMRLAVRFSAMRTDVF